MRRQPAAKECVRHGEVASVPREHEAGMAGALVDRQQRDVGVERRLVERLGVAIRHTHRDGIG